MSPFLPTVFDQSPPLPHRLVPRTHLLIVSHDSYMTHLSVHTKYITVKGTSHFIYWRFAPPTNKVTKRTTLREREKKRKSFLLLGFSATKCTTAFKFTSFVLLLLLTGSSLSFPHSPPSLLLQVLVHSVPVF